MTLKRSLPLIAVAIGLVIVGVVASHGTGGVLDPNGTGPEGAKALVLLLRQYGAQVDVVQGAPTSDDTTALVLDDQLDTQRRAAVGAWVASGHTLVVADPLSLLQVGAATGVGDPSPVGPCAVAGLGAIGRLDVGNSLYLRVPPGSAATGCFGKRITEGATVGPAWFLLSAPAGAGTVVALGGAGLWTNRLLDHADNAGLAVALLAPRAGTRVAVLVAAPVGGGSKSAYGLISPRVRTALIELVVAFAVLAWARGRLLGRPVPESQPVRLAGSETVTAVGDLLHRTRNREAAGSELRAGLRRWLGERLGLGARPDPEVLAAAAARATGSDRDTILRLVSDAPVPDDEALIRLAQSIATLRREVTNGPVR